MKARTILVAALALTGCAQQPVYVTTPQTAVQTLSERCRNINAAYVYMTNEIISNGRSCLATGRFSMSREPCVSVAAAIHSVESIRLIDNALACIRSGHLDGLDQSLDEVTESARDAASVVRRIKIAMRIR